MITAKDFEMKLNEEKNNKAKAFVEKYLKKIMNDTIIDKLWAEQLGFNIPIAEDITKDFCNEIVKELEIRNFKNVHYYYDDEPSYPTMFPPYRLARFSFDF